MSGFTVICVVLRTQKQGLRTLSDKERYESPAALANGMLAA